MRPFGTFVRARPFAKILFGRLSSRLVDTNCPLSAFALQTHTHTDGKMGGGNLQKSQMARERKQAAMQKEGQGGGGAAGLKSRQADASVHAAAQAARLAKNAEREERERLKKEKEDAVNRKAAKDAAKAALARAEAKLEDLNKVEKAPTSWADLGLPPEPDPGPEIPAALSVAEYTADDDPDATWSMRVFNDFDTGFKAHFPIPSTILFRMAYNVIPKWVPGKFPIGFSFSSKEYIDMACASNAGNKAYAQYHWETDLIGPKPDFGKGF